MWQRYAFLGGLFGYPGFWALRPSIPIAIEIQGRHRRKEKALSTKAYCKQRSFRLYQK
jgi:hypothetical protein